jgi:hypothetical protein
MNSNVKLLNVLTVLNDVVKDSAIVVVVAFLSDWVDDSLFLIKDFRAIQWEVNTLIVQLRQSSVITVS